MILYIYNFVMASRKGVNIEEEEEEVEEEEEKEDDNDEE